MSHRLEFEDRNVEMAVKKACEELNIPREKLKHDVISYGSTGIFGLVGTKKARIRVTIPKSSTEDVLEESDAEQQNKASNKQPIKGTTSKIEVTHDERTDNGFVDDAKNLGRDALQRIIDLITTDATISIKEHSNRIYFHVHGGNSAVLIGKRGQTLEAIQYIIERIVNKDRKEDRVGIRVDVEGYLEKRRISLQRLAVKMAEKVKRTGKAATIEPMNAYDRRTVHIALKNESMVRTQSKGEGFLRKLVIFPKRNSPRKQRSD